jgi:hypothetical protein
MSTSLLPLCPLQGKNVTALKLKRINISRALVQADDKLMLRLRLKMGAPGPHVCAVYTEACLQDWIN